MTKHYFVAGTPVNTEIPENVTTNSLVLIHDTILQHKNELTKHLQNQRGGDAVIDKLSEILRDKPIAA